MKLIIMLIVLRLQFLDQNVDQLSHTEDWGRK